MGFIVDSIIVEKQVSDLIDWVRAEDDLDVTALIVQPRAEADAGFRQKITQFFARGGILGLIRHLALSALVWGEKLQLGPQAQQPATFNKSHPGSVIIEAALNDSDRDVVGAYPEETVRRIEDLKLDVLVHAGSGVLKGAILAAARTGVVALHQGNIKHAGPPGFWEVLQREPCTDFFVYRLHDQPDNAEILFRGSVPTQNNYLKNKTYLSENSTEFFKLVIRRLLDGTVRSEGTQLYYRMPDKALPLRQLFHYLRKSFSFNLARAARKARGIRQHFGVAFVRADWRQADLSRGSRLEIPRGSFIADPFVIERQGRHYIFVEEFRYASEKGVISVYEIAGEASTANYLGVALEEPFHLSYPSIFTAGDDLFLCPESAQSGQIRLYRCLKFPLEWALDTVLMDGVSAVDTTIFERDGRWWMTTSFKSGAFGTYSAMHVFHAPEPRGPWTPVASNPVFVDALKARNGGLLKHSGAIYRLSQQASFGSYGNALSIHKIERLDPSGYEERLVETVYPDFFPGIRGAHHMHNDEDILVYDFWWFSRPRRPHG